MVESESDQGVENLTGSLHLGQLDFTSDNVSLAGLAQRLDDLEDGSLLNGVLDGGKFTYLNYKYPSR
jgi:hypothetical protein